MTVRLARLRNLPLAAAGFALLVMFAAFALAQPGATDGEPGGSGGLVFQEETLYGQCCRPGGGCASPCQPSASHPTMPDVRSTKVIQDGYTPSSCVKSDMMRDKCSTADRSPEGREMCGTIIHYSDRNCAREVSRDWIKSPSCGGSGPTDVCLGW